MGKTKTAPPVKAGDGTKQMVIKMPLETFIGIIRAAGDQSARSGVDVSRQALVLGWIQARLKAENGGKK